MPAESTTGHIAIGSRHHRKVPRRIRNKLKVDERRLNRRVPQPAKLVNWYSVHQKVTCVAVAQRGRSDSPPRRNRAQLLSPFHRRLHPAPGCCGMSLDDSYLTDVPIGQGAAQRPVQLRMHRHQRDLPPLPERTRSVGLGVSSDRSRTSRSSASDTRRPARHCSSISSFAFGLGADLMMTFTWSASRYPCMRFWRLATAPSCVFLVTSAGPAAAGDCGGRFGGQSRTLTLM